MCSAAVHKTPLTFLSWVENQKQDLLLLGNLIPDGNDKFNMHIKYITVLPVSQSGMPERPLVDNLRKHSL